MTFEEENRYWAECYAKAQAIVDELLHGLPGPEFDWENSKIDQVALHKARIEDLIKQNLNADSLHCFFVLAGKYAESFRARSRALMLHAENHLLKQEVFQWMDNNYVVDASGKPNMRLDDAADKIAGIVVPLEWRTVRNHITEWKKTRLPSAGRE